MAATYLLDPGVGTDLVSPSTNHTCIITDISYNYNYKLFLKSCLKTVHYKTDCNGNREFGDGHGGQCDAEWQDSGSSTLSSSAECSKVGLTSFEPDPGTFDTALVLSVVAISGN